MRDQSKVLVIGAAGFIGSHLLEKLSCSGVPALAFDINSRNICNKADWIIGSITDETLLSSAMAGCKTVMYLASSSLPATSNHDIASEVIQHVGVAVKAAEIACRLGVEKFIFASSGGTVYGVDKLEPIDEENALRPRNAYGVSKAAIESYLGIISNIQGLKTISLRISNPYGEFQHSLRGQGFVAATMRAAFFDEPLTIWGDGNVTRDFIYVGDVVSAFLAAHRYDGPSIVVNIGSSVGVKLRNIISKIEEISKRKISLTHEPSRVIDVKNSVLAIEKARNILGWSPMVRLEEGLEVTAEWWQWQARTRSL